MLSIDLFDSKFEKKLHEGALDDTITRTQAHLMEPLSRRAADIRTQIRRGKLNGAELDKLEKEYEDLVQKRLDIMLDRQPKNEQQVPSKQDPFAYVKPEPKGIGDIQDPKQKMAQLAQRSKKGPLANVGAGLKAFIKGEPEPMGEEQGINPRALGVANFQRLVKANMGNIPTVSLEFIRPEENFKLDQKGLDLISDYYDGLENDQAKNYFIYRVLPSGDETLKVLKQLGWTPQQVQPSLPGIPTQGELPLQEKKKSNSDDLEAGDVKVARELQKLRAQYPAARSDVEAVARAEIDSTERSQQQLAAIRGANEKQDALLKQLVALDQEQGREINNLDKENDSLEKQLDRVQSTNSKLAQTVNQMTGAKKSTRGKTAEPGGVQTRVIDIIPNAPADAKNKPTAVPAAEPEPRAVSNAPGTSAMTTMARQLGGFSNVVPLKTMKPGPETELDLETEPAPASIRKATNDGKQEKAAESKVHEHGGGIGPKQHWQDLMQEGQPQELINRYLAIDAETDVEAVRAAIQAISKDPGLGANSKSRLLGQIGMIIRRHRLPIGRSYYTYMQQYMEDISETALNPKDPKDDYEAKRRALHDLSLNKDVDQAAVLQRRLDLDREAKAKGLAETVTNVKAGMAEIYRRLAPKIERHRDSFLAGQLYDELENYAELHGAEGEFKRMMSTARNRAHMEYDTNPGGFHNWFWFLPFEDDSMTEGTDDIKKRMSKLEALALAANRAGDDAKCKMYQQKIQSLKQKLSQSMAEGWSDQGNLTPYSVYIDGREWRAYKSDEHARAVAEKVRTNLKRQGRDQTVTIAPSKTKRVQESDEQLLEGIKDTASATAVIACLLTGGSLTGCATAPQQTSAQQVLKTGQDVGRVVYNAKQITRAGTQAEVQQELMNIARGMGSRPEELNNSGILRVWRKLKGQPPIAPEPQAPEYGPAAPVKRPAQFEAKEIHTREDFIKERDRLLRMIGQETNPANKQILKSAIRQLENRAENEGWITIQNRMVREDNNSGAAEQAILKRIMVAHTDLLKQFGPQKVMQAAEEVAYNVGDVDEIGSSDVSGWVNQVRQILGVDA